MTRVPRTHARGFQGAADHVRDLETTISRWQARAAYVALLGTVLGGPSVDSPLLPVPSARADRWDRGSFSASVDL